MTNYLQNKETVKETGLIHIYTGTGKGKTTAAVGLAARALGSGLSVCYCSFHKDPEKYGYTEMESLKKLGAHVINFAKYHPHMVDKVSDDILSELMESIHFDLLILDEIFISIRDKYLNEERLIQFIENKPKTTELVLTGRGATEKAVALAHYVTNMENVKHPYYNNISSRKGIEY